MRPVPSMSAEDRARYFAQAHEKRAALIASQHELRQDWLGADMWADLARERGIKLPDGYVRPTPTLIRRWLRRVDMSAKEFLEWGGYSSLDEFAEKNPRWPLRALVGVLLEYVDERDAARETLREKLNQ